MIMIDEKNKAKKFLVEELKKVPNREICKVITKEQFERVVKELDLETMKNYLENCALSLTVADIPDDMWFETILYLVLLTERTEGCTIFYLDENLFDLNAETKEKISVIKKTIGYVGEISLLEIDLLLKYCKSERPDF